MGITVGKRASWVAIVLSLFTLFAACGSPTSEESASQGAASKKSKCDASKGEDCDEDEDGDPRDASLEVVSAGDAAVDANDAAPSSGDSGACRAVNLVASRAYSPTVWTDGSATFSPPLRFKLPAFVPVTAGNGGNHALTLTFSQGTGDAGTSVICTYEGGSPKAHPTTPADIAAGQKYLFASCTDSSAAGAVVQADAVTLHVHNGDSKAGTTSVVLTLNEEQPCGPPACNPQTCDDHNACNGVESCAGNACQAGTPPVVDDGNACTVDACNPQTGVSHTPVSVDDNDACTVDACNPQTGVSHTPVAIDDGNACTVDACNAQTGVSHTPVAVDDGNACTADSCNPITGVSHTPVAMDDGDACTADSCNPITGVSHTAVPVDDGDACTADSCNPITGVSHTAVSVDDSNACTVDGCNSQTGVSHTPVSIDDGNACTADACNPITGVSHAPVPQGALCGVAQDACSGAFACDGAGACVQGPPPATDDGNDCTADACNPITGVSHTPVSAGTACGDNSNKCVGAFACNETAQCTQGAAPVVNDQNPCTADSCNPSVGVVHTPLPQGTACGDNSNLCVGAFTCNLSAQCNQGPAPTVDDGNICTIDACSPNSGVSHTTISGCDPTPTEGEGVFEKRASLLGRVVDKNGNAVTGVTFQVRDLPADVARSDMSVSTANDGSFRVRLTTFSDHEVQGVGAQHVSLWIDAPGKIRAYRDAWVRPGDGVDLGEIVVIAADPNVTVIGPSGGTATDSQGLVELVVPPGALAVATPINITLILAREQVPARLPDATLTTYALHLEPGGTVFSVPTTARVKNVRNVPNTVGMPVGVYDQTLGVWEHEGSGTLNGSFWEFPVSHFSEVDLNPNLTLGDLFFFWQNGFWPQDSQKKCGHSSLGLANGSVQQHFTLPGVTARGRASTLTFNYDSGLAGDRQFDHGPLSEKGLGVSIASFRAETASSRGWTACLPRGTTSAGGSGNSCSAQGACVLGSVVAPVTFNHRWPAGTADNSLTIDPNQSAIETGSFLGVPLDDQGLPIGTSFVRRDFEMRVGTNTACAGASVTQQEFGIDRGGPGIPVSLQPGAMAQIAQRVLVHHRHGSPFGAGWGISEIDRVFEESPDHFILVTGDGNEEEFLPRAEIKRGFTFANSGAKPVFARERSTGKTFALTAQGDLVEIKSDLTVTPMLSGLSLPGRPYDLAVADVSSQRVFVAACANGLATISPGGQVTVLTTRVPSADTRFNQSHVAARGALAYYVSGDAAQPVLYKFVLSNPNPTPIALSLASNGDQRLDPKQTLSGIRFPAPTGLAMTSVGELYLADRIRNAVYRIAPDAQGEIGPTSVVRRAVGSGGANVLLPLGERHEGTILPVGTPLHVTVADDDTILVGTLYGALQYRRTLNGGDAAWLVYNDFATESDLQLDWSGHIGEAGNLTAIGPRTFLVNVFSTVTAIDIPTRIASHYAPTRTLEKVNGSYFLVDGSAGTREAFDSVGRMIESGMRTGETLLTVQYADAQTGKIATLGDAVGTWTFGYDQRGKVQSVTDPTGRVTTLAVDSFGDLHAFTTASGSGDDETHLFAYSGHKMTSKTSPSGQSSSYEYNLHGNVTKATKGTGEVTTISASLDAPAQKDSVGNPIRTGSYTDAFNVTHTITTNRVGMVDVDTWTADAQTYTRQAIYDTYLYANVPNTGASDTRLNKIFLPAYHVLNGVQEDRFVRWDVRGRVYRVGNSSNPAQDFVFLSYDENDRLVRYDGPAPGNDITRWEYENATPEARLVSVFRPAFSGGNETNTPAQETRWQYLSSDPFLPSAMVTHGVTYTYGYDSTGNLQSVKDGLLQGTTVYGRDARGNVTSVDVKDAANVKVTSSRFDFDAQDRLTASRDDDGNQTDYDYKWQGCGCTEGDKLTGVHTPDLPSGLKWELRYDPTSGRLAKLIDPDLHETSLGYTPKTNRLASVIDANNHAASMGYDQLGRLATAGDALGRTYTRAYPIPASGAWTGVSVLAGSPNGTAAPTDLTVPLADGQYQIGISRYQDRGNPAQESFYRDATFELSYGMNWDNAKRLTYRRDRGTGITSGLPVPAGTGSFDDQSFSYDIRSGGAAVTSSVAAYGGFTETSTAVYDDELDVVSRVGDGQRLPRVQAESFQRDAAGRVTQVSRTISTFMNEPSQLQGVPAKSTSPLTVVVPALKYTYDANGRVKQWTDADGVHDVLYDTRGLLAKITVQGEGDFVFSYDTVGRNTRLVYPGGFQRDQVFDHEGRLTERCYSHPSGPTRCYRAAYDNVGNPTSLQDPEDTDAITYDDLDRLSSIQRGNQTQTYAYNALGALHDNGGTLLDDQRPKLVGGGNAPSAVPATYNSLPVNLDLGGRITLLDGVTLKYSRRGALIGATKVSGPTTLGEWYGHDPDGRRISRTVASTTNSVTTFPDEEYFAWTGGNVTARLDKTGAVRQGFLFEGVDKPLRLRDTASNLKYFYELDIAGNVRRLRRTDGSDAGGYRYAGFGGELSNNVAPAVDQPLRWKARWWSDFAKLYDVRARQWSPGLGSFTSIDEFGYHLPTGTLWSWPLENPTRYADQSGRIAPLFALAAIVTAAVVMAFTVEGHDAALTSAGNGPDAIFGASAHLIAPFEAEAAAEIGLALLRTQVARAFIGNFRAVVLGDMSAFETSAVRSCPVRGGLGPVLKGQAGVQRAVDEIEAKGGTVIGREITVEANGVRTRPDLLIRTSDGELRFVEVKNGPNAGLTANQIAAFPGIEAGGAIPVGKNALGAGLTPGVALPPIPVDILRY